jgi:rubrerythrin
MISRRQLLYFSAILSASSPVAIFKCFAAENSELNNNLYSLTISLLKEAYWAEKIANSHYVEFCQKALAENYPNIAYLFTALSVSEKIHAKNYKTIIESLGSKINGEEINVTIGSTKQNLRIAAIKELEKINEFYPRIIKDLSSESHDQSVINCMYSWKSHQQHEKMIASVKRYSGLFFSSLARKIEDMDLNYHVCEICGSTINELPEIPCEICNYPASHYKGLARPLLKST